MIKKKPIEIQDWENEGGACKPSQISLDHISLVQRADSSVKNHLERFTSWIAENPIKYLVITILFGCVCAVFGSQCHKI